MRCEKCRRPIRPGATQCMYCGGKPRGSEQGEKPVPCPRCRGVMSKVQSSGLTLDVCECCGGTWYDRNELEHHLCHHQPPERNEDDLWEGLGNTTPEPERRSYADRRAEYLDCPHCRQKMYRKDYQQSGVIVDYCGEHGVFLDRDEIAKIHAALTRTEPSQASTQGKPEYQARAQQAWEEGRLKLRDYNTLATGLSKLFEPDHRRHRW